MYERSSHNCIITEGRLDAEGSKKAGTEDSIHSVGRLPRSQFQSDVHVCMFLRKAEVLPKA